MQIKFTKHAREKLVERQIKEEWIVDCIENPDLIIPADRGNKAYVKDMGKIFLKTIVAEEGDEHIVITVYWFTKTRLKRYNSN